MSRVTALLAVLFTIPVCSTQLIAQTQFAYRVSFKDKAGSPALSGNPSWLSPRSIARRSNFNLMLDSTDRPVSPIYLDSVLKLTSGILHTRSRWLNQCVLLLTDSSNARQLNNLEFVTRVEWVGYFANGLHQRAIRSVDSITTVTENTLASKTTGSPAYYGRIWDATRLVNGDYLHDIGLTGRGKLIAVIDEGFSGVDTQPAFDSMRSAGRLIDTHNFLYDDSNVFVNYYHGTNVLSPMAAFLPGTYVGAAPHAEYALYITEDGSVTDAIYELDNLIAAMERADSLGADIISASIVYNILISPYNADFTRADLDGSTTNVARAANLAVSKGIVYVSSAGNEGNNAWNFLNSPADGDSVLTVGSVNLSRSSSGFSSPGPNSSGRVKPDVCLLGEPVPVYDAYGNIYNQNGTSFAAPQLAGYVACMLQGNSKAKPSTIRAAVQRCADRFNSPTSKLGYGIPDFSRALPLLRAQTQEPEAEFRIAPNPFSANLQISLPGNVVSPVFRLFDPSGRTISIAVSQTAPDLYKIDMPESLAPRVYFLEASTPAQRLTKRIVRID